MKTKLIGSGGSGTVHRTNNKKICVKTFHDNALTTKDYIFLEALKGSPYFPKMHDYVENEMVVLDYIPHVPIYKCISTKSQNLMQMKWNQFLGKYRKKKVEKQLREAINYCFSRGIIPVDFAQNTALDRKGNVVFLDVGHFEFFKDVPKHLHQNKKDIVNIELKCLINN